MAKTYIIISSTDIGYSDIEGVYQKKETALKGMQKLMAATEKSLAERKLTSRKGKFQVTKGNKNPLSLISYSIGYDRLELFSFELNKNYNKIIHSCMPDDFDTLFTDKDC